MIPVLAIDVPMGLEGDKAQPTRAVIVEAGTSDANFAVYVAVHGGLNKAFDLERVAS